MLDALVNLGVEASGLKAPPAAPADGQRWIVAPGATGAWAGKDLNIAAWQDGAWSFLAPGRGTLAYDAAGNALLFWTGTAWRSIAGLLALLGVTALGIGTAADASNPLSATLNNALFNALSAGAGGSGDLRVKLNKAAAGNTASFLFQDGFSGRAEIGLAGDDNFHVRVSPDGSAFVDAMVVTAASGAVAFAASPTAPTPAPGDSGPRLATTAFVAAAVAALVAAAPGALDTLKELADALGDDPNFATTMLAALGARAPLASPALTGTPSAPTPPFSDSSARLATTAFVAGAADPLAISPVVPTLDYRLTASDCLPPGQFSRLSSGSRTTPAGLLVPVAAGGLRIDHDPVTGAPLGALIEEQRTNLLLSTAALSVNGALAAPWTDLGNLTYATDGSLAPDGSPAQSVTVKSSGDPLIGQQVAYTAAGSAITMSCYVKAKSAAYFSFGFYFGGANAYTYATVKLADGIYTTSGSFQPASVSTKAVGGSWWRVAVTATVPSGSNATRVDIRVYDTPTQPAATGNGLYVANLQLEVGDFPTSYIPTTGAQATRAADSLVVPTTSDWFNSNEGTIFAEFVALAAGTFSPSRAIAHVDDGTGGNRLTFRYDADGVVRVYVVSGYATVGGMTIGTPVPGALTRAVVSYTRAGLLGTMNGAAAGVNTISSPLPASMTAFRLGSENAGAAILCSPIRRAAYFPRALTATQLQAMTS